MHEASQCANCARAIDEPAQKFCPACGQPTPTHRIDWHFLGHELEHSVLHMDRGILYTLKNLMLRPGGFIRDYIEGRRADHVKPLLLIMLTAAVVVFLSKLMLHGDIVNSSAQAGFSFGVKTADGGGKLDVAAVRGVFNAAADWMNRHYAVATLILLPMEAAAFKLAFRRLRNLNYPEWLVICAFLTAQSFLIQALLIPFDAWLPGRQQWALAIALVYSMFSLSQFFQGYARWKTVLRTILGFAIYQLGTSVLMTIAIVAIVAVRMAQA